MGKLTDLKEWLTVADAAKHIAIAYGEEVTEADVLRLGLDGQLRLSVYFVNHTEARCGRIATWEETEWTLLPGWGDKHNPLTAMLGVTPSNRITRSPEGPTLIDGREAPPNLQALLDAVPADNDVLPLVRSISVGNDQFINLDADVVTLTGIWDLPMFGNERLDIEHQYQTLTGGPAVTVHGLDGAFVQGRDGRVCQLQERYLDNEFWSEEQWVKHREDRLSPSDRKGCYPADGLPKDAVIVVRTEYLRDLESPEANVQAGTSHANRSDQLAIMNQASFRFWSKAERTDRGTHPDNATVAEWLIEREFSKSTANIAASIIRPEWAPVGRKPEE